MRKAALYQTDVTAVIKKESELRFLTNALWRHCFLVGPRGQRWGLNGALDDDVTEGLIITHKDVTYLSIQHPPYTKQIKNILYAIVTQ